MSYFWFIVCFFFIFKDRSAYEKFLKINVRHITDGQGVVAGVLLVTPNTVMFDPNVSDPLVGHFSFPLFIMAIILIITIITDIIANIIASIIAVVVIVLWSVVISGC